MYRPRRYGDLHVTESSPGQDTEPTLGTIRRGTIFTLRPAVHQCNRKVLTSHQTQLKSIIKKTMMLTRYCRDRELSCNIYAVQQDTQSCFNDWDYSSHVLARRVSDLTGPSSGAFYKLYLQIWYVVLLCVLLDTSRRYEVTSGRVE